MNEDKLAKEKNYLAGLTKAESIQATNKATVMSEISQILGVLSNMKTMVSRDDYKTAGRYANIASSKLGSVIRGIKNLG